MLSISICAIQEVELYLSGSLQRVRPGILPVDGVLSILPRIEVQTPFHWPDTGGRPHWVIEVSDSGHRPITPAARAAMAQRYPNYRPLTEAVLDQLLATAEEVCRLGRERDFHLLAHCSAGISRSPAAALAILALWHGPGYEQECAERLLEIEPLALPCGDIVAGMDSRLRRAGKLLAAMDRAIRDERVRNPMPTDVNQLL